VDQVGVAKSHRRILGSMACFNHRQVSPDSIEIDHKKHRIVIAQRLAKGNRLKTHGHKQKADSNC
jgi:hypothetical protein